MPQVCWRAAADGRYWLDVVVAGRVMSCMLDLGLVDPHDQLGLEAEPTLYDQCHRAGQLSNLHRRPRRDASGRCVTLDCGELSVQLYDVQARQPVGPPVRLLAARSTPHLPARVGVVFFHRLTGCRVVWDLGARVWCVEYP